jgi:putative glutamine amidotransferase
MKKFLITTKLEIDKFKSRNLSLNLDWYNFAKKNNIELIPICFEDIKKIKSNKIFYDGIIFTGGGNLYSKTRTKENFIRDKFETELLKHCLKNKIKTFFVCRGLQLLVNFYGIKLNNVNTHVVKNQKIYFIDKIFNMKLKKMNVNSYHNYAFKKCPKNFVTKAKHSDETIEIIYSYKYKSLGLMFHPERKNKDEKIVNKIVSKFLNI